MDVKNDLLQKVESIIQIKNYEIKFVCSEAKYIDKKQNKSILLVTDFCFYLFIEQSKDYVTLCQIPWHTVTKITYIDPNTFSISTSSNTYKVCYDKTEELLKKVFDYLENTLLRDEKPDYVNCQSILSNIQHIPTAFIQRFKYKLMLENEQEYPEILVKQLTKIARRKSELDIPSLPNADKYAKILLDCCQIEPTIRSVVLPQGIKCNYWLDLANCLSKNTTLNSIKTNDALTEDFANVCKSLSKNKHTGVVQFSFSRSNITPEYFKYILKMLQSISFNKLSFENAITANNFYDLMQYKGISFAMTSLQSLTFKGIKNLSVKNFLSKLPSLREITINNCDTNIDEFLSIIPTLNLEILFVSGGSATSKLVSEIEFPQTLYSISFENIKWNGDSLNKIWTICIKHLSSGNLLLKECCQRPRINLENTKLKEKDMVSLSFAFADLTKNQWSDFFMSVDMKTVCSTLAELNWSGNPFSPEILHFMMKCSNLHILVADGCFSPDCPGIQDFTDFLNKFNKIKSLSIKGTNDVKLGAASSLMFQNLKSIKSLKELDVSNNDLEDDGLTDLCRLLMKNKSIKKIRFENNEVRTGQAYYSFFEQLKERKTKLDIIYPDKEIYEMHKANIIDAKSVNYILHCYSLISNENDNSSDDDDDYEDSSEGSDIFVANNDPNVKLSPKSSVSKANSDFLGLQNDWVLMIPPVSLPETSNQIDSLNRTYDISTLIQRVKTV